MKILFSLTYYSPYISGLTLYVKRLSESLAGEGYQISVISFQHETKLKTEETINGVRVIRVKPLVKISKGFFSIDWIFKSIREVRKAEIVVINLPQFEGIIPALFGKLTGKKVIVIYHCEVVLPPGLINRLIEKLLNFSNFLTLRLCDKIITYTKDFSNHSKILPRFSRKISYIYPPVKKPEVDKRVQKMIREKIGEKPEFVIGVAARLAAEKGIEYLLEAIPTIKSKIKDQRSKIQIKNQKESLKNTPGFKTSGRWPSRSNRDRVEESGNSTFKILIAGPLEPVGEKKYKDKIMKLVEKYKDIVVFLGSLKEEEMGSFYSLLDVLILPSVNSTEAFGMVQVEAMLMGVPVVACDLPGVRIPVQKTGMGKIVPVGDSSKLAQGVVEVLLNRNKYIKDKKEIGKEFSFEKTIKFYISLFSLSSRTWTFG